MSLLAFKDWAARSVIWVIGALVLFSIVSMMVKALFWSPMKAEKKPVAAPQDPSPANLLWGWVWIVGMVLALQLGKDGRPDLALAPAPLVFALVGFRRWLTWQRVLIGGGIAGALGTLAWLAWEYLPGPERTVATWAFACLSLVAFHLSPPFSTPAEGRWWKGLLTTSLLAFAVWAISTWQAGLYLLSMGALNALAQWRYNAQHT